MGMNPLREALSEHDMRSPLTPAELRELANELEDVLISIEAGFSHRDWRYIDGLRASAAKLEED